MKKNNKMKKIKSVNVLNIFLVLAAISVVIGFLMVFLNDIYSFDGSESLSIKGFEMEIRIENINEDETSIFEDGKRLVIKNTNTVLGVLSEVERNEDNVMMLYLNVVGTYTTDTGFKLNGKSVLKIGDTIELEGVKKSAEIISIYAVK